MSPRSDGVKMKKFFIYSTILNFQLFSTQVNAKILVCEASMEENFPQDSYKITVRQIDAQANVYLKASSVSVNSDSFALKNKYVRVAANSYTNDVNPTGNLFENEIFVDVNNTGVVNYLFANEPKRKLNKISFLIDGVKYAKIEMSPTGMWIEPGDEQSENVDFENGMIPVYQTTLTPEVVTAENPILVHSLDCDFINRDSIGSVQTIPTLVPNE